MKPIRHSVSVVVFEDEDRSRLLAVRRPPDDDELPDIWGLPAATLDREAGESFEEAVNRTGRTKLGVELEVEELLNEGGTERGTDHLHMRLYRGRIASGEPAVPQPEEDVTQYVDWEWAPPERLADGARRGSLCSRLCLEALDREP